MAMWSTKSYFIKGLLWTTIYVLSLINLYEQEHMNASYLSAPRDKHAPHNGFEFKLSEMHPWPHPMAYEQI